MHVTVYFAQDEISTERVLMIVPVDTEPTIVEELKEYGWRLLTTTTLQHQLFDSARPIVEAEIAAQGYSFVKMGLAN